jgi:integrase
MARRGIEQLQVRHLRTRKPGLVSDGGNLNLKTFKTKDGRLTRSWIFRFQLPGGPVRDAGLGSLDSVGLSKARELAGQYREMIACGIDPIQNRNEAFAKTASIRRVPSFDEVAKDYIAAHAPGWRNVKHGKQWQSTLKTYVSPIIGRLPVNAITIDHVLKCVEPIWNEKAKTAMRVRGRIEAILNYATVRKHRQGDNPAKWSGYLSELLARPSKLSPTNHMAALDYKNIAEFMVELRQKEGIAALAMEFLILTCARTAEVRGAVWDEIDMDEALWTVPANRIKAGKEHQVPLSKAAMEVLAKVKGITKKISGAVAKSAFVFPNDRSGAELSNNALLAVLKRMGRNGDVTVHGFRSCFRDWAGEESSFPGDLAEMALAHKISSKVEAAYRRKTGVQKRRAMMESWASYCSKPVITETGKVIAFKA